MIFHWNEYAPQILNVAGKELVSRVRMADEINVISGGKMRYYLSNPGDDFFNNRPMITKMRSKYLYEYSIIREQSFSEIIWREMKGIKI